MSTRSCLLVVAVAMLSAGSAALAAPIVDGNVTLSEYQVILNDVSPETAESFFNTGLDIKDLQFDQDATWNYMALTVVVPPLDTNGGPTSRRFETDFWAIFYDTSGTTPSYYVDVLMNASGVKQFTLEEYVAGVWVPVLLTPADYSVAIGNALELKILGSKMPNLAAMPYVFAQLDDTGRWNDDQIEGVIPEPATLGLMGLGVAALAAGRRKR